MAKLIHVSTSTDLAAGEWAVEDQVIRFREWATGTVSPLPPPPIDEWTIGAAETCALRLEDRAGRVSRLHARLIRSEGEWLLRDEGSKNGVWVDGSRRHEIVLEPGFEIGIGSITLVAESRLSIALHGFLARLIGWGREHAEAVDRALRSVRMAATHRAALLLCGDGNLVPIAHAIHRRSRGLDRPFVVCDPRRQSGKATVRTAENCSTGMDALTVAVGGSVCVRTRRLPPDFHELLEALCEPMCRVQLIVCAGALEECERCRVTPIVLPRVTDRWREIDRIIDEYARDAVRDLGVPPSTFLPVDHAWVRQHAATSLNEIEKATLRLAALRASRTLGGAAARLGMAGVSLSRWIGRRDMPMDISE
jgi:hypothetical protein